jgi:hypothetical protein
MALDTLANLILYPESVNRRPAGPIRAALRLHLCSAQPSSRAGLALRGELPVQAFKHSVGTVIGTHPQNPAPRMLGHAQDFHRHSSESANQEVGVKHTLGGNGFDGRTAGMPLDGEGDFARQITRLSADLLHDLECAQARVGTKQKSQYGRPGGHRQDQRQFQLGLQCRVLLARAQGQFQAVAQRAQIGVAVGDTTDTCREFVVGASTDSQTFKVLPDQRQSGIGGEVAGQFLDNKANSEDLELPYPDL